MKRENINNRTNEMKRILAFLLALCLVAGLCACGGPSDDEIQAVRGVSFDGTELTVTLGTNKSTGYEWDYEIFGACIEPSVNRSFKVSGSKGDATGEASIGFEGKSEGTAIIVLTTPNGWDGTGEGDGYTVNVVVGADGTIEKANGMDGAFPAETTLEPTPEPAPKTSVAIAELKEGTYTGTMSGAEFANSTDTVFSKILPADITVTIESGQITLFCEAITSAYGILKGVKTPQSPDGSVILSGSLPLEQSGDAVIATGEVPISGKGVILNHTDWTFTGWELKEREGNTAYTFTVRIAMENGIPVAAITADYKTFTRTATVPLALRGEGANELLSAPYADMLRSGAYQYSYLLPHKDINFIATIAAKDGMTCRRVVSEDGTFHKRVLCKDGKAYQINDLSGAVQELGAEGYETPPDYAGTLTFVNAKALETGAVAEAYDFEYQGKPCRIVFVFSEGKPVEFVTTIDGATEETFVMDMTGAPDMALFDLPQ